LFKQMTNVEMTHIPYRGGGPAMTALVAGEVDVMFAVAPVAVPQIQSDIIRGLGVTSTQRLPQLPDLATLSEAGLPGFEVSARYACFTTAGTSVEIVKKISADVASVLKEPAVAARLEKLGYLVEGSTPEELNNHLKTEFGQWGKIIKEIGISAKTP
jgi:tripartite-type tricarboxylate transporter receptor subunit TctC